MNGLHDMGGMDGFGAVVPEANEPVFHEAWEARVFAIIMFGLGRWQRGRDARNLRFELERLPPEDYLGMSYYERWLRVGLDGLLRTGLVTRTELASGRADPGRPRPRLLDSPDAPSGGTGRLELDVVPRFGVGEAVRARNLHPRGHTRLPRYARGKRGRVILDHGVYALQDTDDEGLPLGPDPQHVYTVRFESDELWGDRASARDAVCVDLWESYLEPA